MSNMNDLFGGTLPDILTCRMTLTMPSLKTHQHQSVFHTFLGQQL
jgi:hypothetical protein